MGGGGGGGAEGEGGGESKPEKSLTKHLKSGLLNQEPRS